MNKFSVYQHWDPLKVCIVGRSYSPDFYSFISSPKVRSIFEKIATETEEDYQKLIKLLKSFNVDVLRPDIDLDFALERSGTKYKQPPMNPRDYGGMFGETFYFDIYQREYESIIKKVSQTNEVKHTELINTAITTRVGKDLYIGTKANADYNGGDIEDPKQYALQNDKEWSALDNEFKTKYRTHWVDTEGHADGCFCPVVPGLIITRSDMRSYSDTFPDWEIVQIDSSYHQKLKSFKQMKRKNEGKWWVKGEEFNDEFIEFIDSWVSHWVGFVDETIFDVNILMIDQKNAAVNGYNKKVYSAMERHGVTPHLVKFRHRFFWDSGLHCVTQDLDREGILEDFFPYRG